MAQGPARVKTVRLRLLLVLLAANLVYAAGQGCFGARPAHAGAQAAVGDNIVVPLNRIADAVERILKHMEAEKEKRQ